MPNGFSDKEMIVMVLEGQAGLQRQLALLVDKVDAVMQNGCTHRVDDLRRIEELEGWRTKGIVGIIVLAVGVIVDFVAGHK